MSFPGSRHVSPRTETVPTSSTKGAKARLVHGMATCPRCNGDVGYAPSFEKVSPQREKKTASFCFF